MAAARWQFGGAHLARLVKLIYMYIRIEYRVAADASSTAATGSRFDRASRGLRHGSVIPPSYLYTPNDNPDLLDKALGGSPGRSNLMSVVLVMIKTI